MDWAMFALMVAVLAAMFGMMWRMTRLVSHTLDKRLEDFQTVVNTQFAAQSTRIDGLEQRMNQLEQRMDRLDGRMNRLEQRMDRLDGRMDDFARQMHEDNAKVMEHLTRLYHLLSPPEEK